MRAHRRELHPRGGVRHDPDPPGSRGRQGRGRGLGPGGDDLARVRLGSPEARPPAGRVREGLPTLAEALSSVSQVPMDPKDRAALRVEVFENALTHVTGKDGPDKPVRLDGHPGSDHGVRVGLGGGPARAGPPHARPRPEDRPGRPGQRGAAVDPTMSNHGKHLSGLRCGSCSRRALLRTVRPRLHRRPQPGRDHREPGDADPPDARTGPDRGRG